MIQPHRAHRVGWRDDTVSIPVVRIVIPHGPDTLVAVEQLIGHRAGNTAADYGCIDVMFLDVGHGAVGGQRDTAVAVLEERIAERNGRSLGAVRAHAERGPADARAQDLVESLVVIDPDRRRSGVARTAR